MKPWLFAVACALPLGGCGAAGAGQPEPLPVIDACFVAGNAYYPVTLEVASEARQRERGLMGRESLAENAGMLFEYQKQRPGSHGFWMYQTLIPLDIAYLDEQGVIVSVREMHPCASSRGADCPSYPAGAAFRSAVEMNAGYFSARGLSEGDRFVRPAEGTCPP